MTRNEFAIGSAIFLVVIVAGFFSSVRVDRYYAASPAQVPPTSSACVADDGSWKNWLWPNVPVLSPKCK
ncbi:MAG: hypothetical protein KGJ00_15370 [Bradyrhizobium sp.]|nr:hypothetical protein [Bradyrhizobium sp.]